MFPLFNIHTKLSLVILCMGIITDFINKRKHSASSWLQFSSVSSPLNRVMYTLTDQYHGVTQRRKQHISKYICTSIQIHAFYIAQHNLECLVQKITCIFWWIHYKILYSFAKLLTFFRQLLIHNIFPECIYR